MSDPTRIMVAGDFHANTHHQGYIFTMAKNMKCNAIVQVGDFGYWPQPAGAVEMVDHAAKMFKRTGIPLYWIDGNHEHFDMLEAFGAFGGEGFQELAPGVTYIPRGTRWEWSGTSFLAFGGAFSIDKALRTEGVSWFRQETASYTELDKVFDQEPVDIMITHDAPVLPPADHFNKSDAESAASRRGIAEMVDHLEPKLLVHGHYHYRYDSAFTSPKGIVTQICGLDCDGAEPHRGSWDFIDLPLGSK